MQWPRDFVPNVARVEEALKHVTWPSSWPYTDSDFRREDEAEDEVFYAEPRFVSHIDNNFIESLKGYYAEAFASYPDARVLDLCSSWTSHFPDQKCWSHVSITGMNEDELKRNPQADDYTVQNLNAEPVLPYGDASFDVVTCAVSFDYLTKPLLVMAEIARVLKPAGTVILAASNRSFPEKAVEIWTRTGTLEHVLIYGSYLHFAGAFEAPEARDLSPLHARSLGVGSPLHVVQAKKRSEEDGEGVVAAAGDGEVIHGLMDWLEARRLRHHHAAITAWAADLGAVDFVEVAENADELVEFMGNRLTGAERLRLLKGVQCFK